MEIEATAKFEFPSVALLREDTPWRKIERAARVCYNSKMSEDPEEGKSFVEGLVAHRHMTPLEHCMVQIPESALGSKQYLLNDTRVCSGKYSRLGLTTFSGYVAGTARTFLEAGFHLRDILDHPQCLQVSWYLTAIIHTDRGIANEFVRHRVAAYEDNWPVGWVSGEIVEPSLVQQSTRFVKFRKECTFMLPETESWSYRPEDSQEYAEFMVACQEALGTYNRMLALGQKPQIARNVLPLATGTIVVMSATFREWEQILTLRMAPDAHPEARVVAAKIHNCFGLGPVFVPGQRLLEYQDEIYKLIEKAKGERA